MYKKVKTGIIFLLTALLVFSLAAAAGSAMDDSSYLSMLMEDFVTDDYTARVYEILASLCEINDFDIHIEYADGQLLSIDGMFSFFPVDSPETAEEALYEIGELLGINSMDSLDSFEPVTENYAETGVTYTMQQMYDGLEVYGRTVTVITDPDGITSGLSSGFLKGINLSTDHEKSYGDVMMEIEDTYHGNSPYISLIVYTLDPYETHPVMAYYIEYESQEGEPFAIILDANSFELLDQYSLVMTDDITGKGKDAMGEDKEFPVYLSGEGASKTYQLKDKNNNICLYQIDATALGGISLVSSDTNQWTGEKTSIAISAYVNTITTYKWWEKTVGRKSIDNASGEITVVVHNTTTKDNASWNCVTKRIKIYENASPSKLARTPAAGLDIIAHEYTHGVFQSIMGGKNLGNLIPGAINEAYADIFGCLVENINWTMGENVSKDKVNGFRNIANPLSTKNPVKVGGKNYIDPSKIVTPNSDNDYGGIHNNSTIISHAAYLMLENKIPVKDLATIWYQSMLNGYDASSKWTRVRSNVLLAAKTVSLKPEQYGMIDNIFKTAGIENEPLKIVLSWDASCNLDASLMGPLANNPFEFFDVDKASKEYTFLKIPYASLDKDVTTGPGEETITIANETPLLYCYCVRIPGSTETTNLKDTGAEVNVYRGASKIPVATFTVPDTPGQYWRVFYYNSLEGTFETINSMSD